MRKYRTLFLEIPRKNGKSTFGAGLGLYLLAADNESGPEIYSAAGDREQAAIIYDLAKSMVEADPDLKKRIELYRRTMVYPQKNGFYKVLSAEAYTKHGLNAHGILFDELHVQKNRELYDVLVTSTGARKQPLTILITTAGYDKQSLCYDMYEYAKRVEADPEMDPTFLSVIYEAPSGSDWTKQKTWAVANPNLGISPGIDFLAAECRKAQEQPSYENTFKRLYLNIWTEQETRWLQMDKWNACKPLTPKIIESFEGQECWAGLDLSTRYDLTALCLAFPQPDGTIAPLLRFWLPENELEKRCRREGIRYDLWAKNGLLTLTPGDTVDYSFIHHEVMELAQQYYIQELAYDPYNAYHLIQLIEQDGIKCVPFRQGYLSMSPAAKEFEKLIHSGNFRHGGHQILTWNAECATIISDPAGNIKPVKPQQGQRGKKIDGIIAAIMATSRALTADQAANIDDLIL